MDTLAYIHAAQASEDPEILNLRRFNWAKIVSIPLTLTLISSASQAMALLRRGDSGPQVIELQNQLKSLGYFDGPVTGFFASLTLDSVSKFQADQGLPVDGIVGTRTKAAIDAKLTSKAHPASPTVASSSSLFLGMSGPQVQKLQTDLRFLKFYNQEPTGQFDAVTERAVINFQSARGLQPDGIAGPRTLASLSQIIGAKTTPLSSLPRSEVLRFHSQGDAVRTLQIRLAQLGYYTGGITGVFEEKTADSVVRFQKDRALKADGVVGPTTWEELGAS
jgi:peptidoglycan hydrolase-like protein with peptidoglycan-binding domain